MNIGKYPYFVPFFGTKIPFLRVLMVSLLIRVLEDNTLVDSFNLSVPEFQAGNSAFVTVGVVPCRLWNGEAPFEHQSPTVDEPAPRRQSQPNAPPIPQSSPIEFLFSTSLKAT